MEQSIKSTNLIKIFPNFSTSFVFGTDLVISQNSSKNDG